MRRRRGETSLFEILNPRPEEPGGDTGLWDRMRTLGRRPGVPSENSESVAGDAAPAASPPRPEKTRPTVSPRRRPRVEGKGSGPPRLRAHGLGSAGGASEPLSRPPLQSSFTNPSLTHPVEGSNFWAWLNRPVETRYATIAVYGVGVLLALYLAYLSGRMVTHPLEKQLDQATPYSPALIDPAPHFKAPFREVRSESDAPVPARESGDASTRASEPRGASESPEQVQGSVASDPSGAPHQAWGIVVHEGKELETSERLMTQLDTYDKKVGKKVGMDSVRVRGVNWYRIYFGPFDSEQEAQDRVEAVRSLPGIHNLKKNFSDAYVRRVTVD